jgi:hypothetical protein
VDEWTPPLLEDGSYQLSDGAYGPDGPSWTYQADEFYSTNISGAQRLPNGNTLVCEGGEGRFFEVTPDGQRIWEYLSPDYGTGLTPQGEYPPEARRGNGLGNATFRATWIGADHPGLAGRDLEPGPPIEEMQ